MNAEFKKTVPPSPTVPPEYSPPWPPWESKKFLGGFWHLSYLKFQEISPKIPWMQSLRKLAPLPLTVPPDYSPPWPPWESKKFWGGFWHLSKLKFEEISPKIPRMQILRKLAPLAPLLLAPLSPLGIPKYYRDPKTSLGTSRDGLKPI